MHLVVDEVAESGVDLRRGVQWILWNGWPLISTGYLNKTTEGYDGASIWLGGFFMLRENVSWNKDRPPVPLGWRADMAKKGEKTSLSPFRNGQDNLDRLPPPVRYHMGRKGKMTIHDEYETTN